MRLLLRSALALSVVVLGLTLVLGDAPTVRANLEHCDNPVPWVSGFGGGGGYCPAEYSTCEDQDGDGCIDIDIGGGGGGGDWVPLPDCFTTTVHPTFVTSGWIVSDFGRCSSATACTRFRDQGNVGRTAEGPRWRCWSSQYEPDTRGQHLVLAFRYRCGSTETTSQVDSWTVTDLGRCASVTACSEKAAGINGSFVFAGTASCWQSAQQPGTAGQHLVIAVPTPPDTVPPGDLPPGDLLVP